MVVEVPVDAGEGVRTARDLSMWEQLSFAAFLQRYWADNQARAHAYIFPVAFVEMTFACPSSEELGIPSFQS